VTQDDAATQKRAEELQTARQHQPKKEAVPEPTVVEELVEPTPPGKQIVEELIDHGVPDAYSLFGRPTKSMRQNFPKQFPTKKPKRPKATHDQVTRRWLAILILGIVGLINIGIFTSFLLGGITDDQLTKAVAALSGPQALAAAAAGFYYADRRGHKQN
jgi:hypothetical protein